MYSITFIMPGVARVWAITTPHKGTAWIIGAALETAGFRSRIWRGGALVG